MPSNIALIKYMGKSDVSSNTPSNGSLSWTIPYLTTTVELEGSEKMGWQPLPSDFALTLSQKGQDRYLNFFEKLKKQFNLKGNWTVRSANNFPSDCGIASSASSFAALTHCFFGALQEQTPICNNGSDNNNKSNFESIKPEEQAQWSSKGSGSSCRSFLPGWVEWDGNKIYQTSSAYDNLLHFVVLVEESVKKVSSSEAHKRVKSSLLFSGRSERVNSRLNTLKTALTQGEWSTIFELSWAEFWDMHSLFETSVPSFGYMTSGSFEVLNSVRQFWEVHGDGPVVTMDAGPNIHFLWRSDQASAAHNFFNEFLHKRYSCLTNHPEIGFARI